MHEGALTVYRDYHLALVYWPNKPYRTGSISTQVLTMIEEFFNIIFISYYFLLYSHFQMYRVEKNVKDALFSKIASSQNYSR